MKKTFTANKVKEEIENAGIGVSQVSKKRDGNFIYRKEFYYKHGETAKNISEKLKKAFQEIEIIDTNDIMKGWNGGASVKNSSHFYVEFKINN